MLINLSNHPSSRWTATQLAAAQKEYNTITDIPFPNIPPALSAVELEKLVDKYLADIIPQQAQAVHLMGEMTFTYRLVKKLKKAGIPCIASTTNRTVEEKDGKKIVLFEFVQFREY